MITVGGSQIPANSTKDFSFPIKPADVNSRVALSPVGPLDASWIGLTWCAWVDAGSSVSSGEAAGTLKVRVVNVTALPITPVAQSFTFHTT